LRVWLWMRRPGLHPEGPVDPSIEHLWRGPGGARTGSCRLPDVHGPGQAPRLHAAPARRPANPGPGGQPAHPRRGEHPAAVESSRASGAASVSRAGVHLGLTGGRRADACPAVGRNTARRRSKSLPGSGRELLAAADYSAPVRGAFAPRGGASPNRRDAQARSRAKGEGPSMQKESLRSPLAHLDAPLRDTRRAAGVASRHQLAVIPSAKIWWLLQAPPRPGAARLVGLRGTLWEPVLGTPKPMSRVTSDAVIDGRRLRDAVGVERVRLAEVVQPPALEGFVRRERAAVPGPRSEGDKLSVGGRTLAVLLPGDADLVPLLAETVVVLPAVFTSGCSQHAPAVDGARLPSRAGVVEPRCGFNVRVSRR
jgi:hypothetical protein